MMSSVTLPNVALISPPMRGPVCSASCSVERPISPASGRIAAADVRKIARSAPPGELEHDRDRHEHEQPVERRASCQRLHAAQA